MWWIYLQKIDIILYSSFSIIITLQTPQFHWIVWPIQKKKKKHGLYINTASRIYICIQHSYPHYWLFDAVTNILTWVAHWLYITTAQQDTCIYMHTTLWDITTYLGQGHSSLLIIWCSDQYTYMSCVHLCVCHDNILSVMIACKQI